MSFDFVEGLTNEQILEIYDNVAQENDDSMISPIWYVECANGTRGYYSGAGYAEYGCRYCAEYCSTWKLVCGGRLYNGRYAYECVTANYSDFYSWGRMN